MYKKSIVRIIINLIILTKCNNLLLILGSGELCVAVDKSSAVDSHSPAE